MAASPVHVLGVSANLLPGTRTSDNALPRAGSRSIAAVRGTATRTTIIRLADGGLVVISPPPVIGRGTAAALGSFGSVEHVAVPNTFYYVYAADFLGHYPDARLLVAPGLFERVLGATTG